MMIDLMIEYLWLTSMYCIGQIWIILDLKTCWIVLTTSNQNGGVEIEASFADQIVVKHVCCLCQMHRSLWSDRDLTYNVPKCQVGDVKR